MAGCVVYSESFSEVQRLDYFASIVCAELYAVSKAIAYIIIEKYKGRSCLLTLSVGFLQFALLKILRICLYNNFDINLTLPYMEVKI